MLISIQHQKGGTSKSTIAWNLAISLSNATNKIIEVVDLDVQQTLTLNNYVRKNKGMKPLSIRTFKDVDSLKSYFETDNDEKIIICDTGGFDSKLNRYSAIVSDFIITPVSDSTIDLQGLKTYEKVLKQVSDSTGGIITSSVVLSPVDPRRKNFNELRDYINESEHFNVIETVIRRRADYISSITAGKSVQEYKKDSKASIEFESLVQDIRKIMSL